MLDSYKKVYEKEADKIPNWKKINKNDLINLYIENENNPVLGDETTGSLFDPWILTNEMGGYQMYISSRKTSSIVLSYSSDGIIWSKDFITCLESDNSTGWEDIINRACVIKMPDKYTGQSNNVSRIGYAESYDGKIFSRI